MPAIASTPHAPRAALRLGLGIDAGGTQTRWALADARGTLLADGVAPALSGLQLGDAAGRAHVAAALREIAASPALLTRQLDGVVAGVSGVGTDQLGLLARMLASACGVAPAAVQAMSDIELACRSAFAAGEGYVVYAGTGSIAAYLDAAGTLHRAGGRGVVIDDAGGGHWIAREALRRVWRAQDEAPGDARATPLARGVFEHVGGSDWAQTRHWVYGGAGASRGGLGTLALAVAAAYEQDAEAREILQAAGRELARLARALIGRHGMRPIVLAGRVFDLHDAIEQSLRAALPPQTRVTRATQPAHHAAARRAALTAVPDISDRP